MTDAHLQQRVEDLRRAFDDAFAREAVVPRRDRISVILLRSGGAAYALRVSEMAALAVDRKIMPLPGAPPALAGLAGIEGRLVGVYAIGALLGQPWDRKQLRWIATHGMSDVVGLGFEELVGYVEVEREALYVPQERSGAFLAEAFRHGGTVVHLVDVAAIARSVRDRVSTAGRST